jgi:Spy/CpxP family protein refolding chaperone
MSGLKSSWELSLERSDDLVPELKSKKKLTKKQKEQIAEIRKEYAAKTADRDVMMQDKVRKLPDRVPSEEIEEAKINLEAQFREEKASLAKEMEKKIESIRNSKG